MSLALNNWALNTFGMFSWTKLRPAIGYYHCLLCSKKFNYKVALLNMGPLKGKDTLSGEAALSKWFLLHSVKGSILKEKNLLLL